MKIINTITYILMDDLKIRDVFNQLTEVKLLMVASVRNKQTACDPYDRSTKDSLELTR